jgi:hypothetical protein
MQDNRLHRLLSNLPHTSFPNEVTFLSTTVPEFISILGYDKSQLFFEADIWFGSIRKRVDCLVASSLGSRPWLVIETKLKQKGIHRLPLDWVRQLQAYQAVIQCEYAVLLSPELLVISQLQAPNSFEIKDYWLARLNEVQAKAIQSLLARPEQLPTESLPFPSPPSTIIDTERYKIDISIYAPLLEAVFKAESNNEKKKSLEKLAKYLFETIPFLSCKYIDLRTRSSEIDIIVEFRGADRLTIFDEYGRYFLIECKNWKESVGAAQVRDFIGKLRKSRTKLGVILAKNGISGERNGAEAVLEIHTAFHTDGVYVLVISEEDLRAVERGDNFYDILDKKIDNLRFDI